jgi:hypothetical protein
MVEVNGRLMTTANNQMYLSLEQLYNPLCTQNTQIARNLSMAEIFSLQMRDALIMP